MRLAALWGRPLADVRRLLTQEELSLWIAFGSHEGPWWSERSDALHALQCQVIAAAAGSKVPAKEFLPRWGKPSTAPTLISWGQAVQILKAMRDKRVHRAWPNSRSEPRR